MLAYSQTIKYDEQDRQGKAAFNERSPHPTQQQALKTIKLHTLLSGVHVNISFFVQ
jgi:hypothetical protein